MAVQNKIVTKGSEEKSLCNRSPDVLFHHLVLVHIVMLLNEYLGVTQSTTLRLMRFSSGVIMGSLAVNPLKKWLFFPLEF